MRVPKKKELKKNPIRWVVELLLILTFVGYVVPDVKHALFPNQMTHLEKMLRQSTMDGYHLAVDRQSESKIILTVFTGARSITTEI